MSEAHGWAWLGGRPSAMAYMTMEDYLALPEDIAKGIEVTGGLVAFCESPSEAHIGIQQNLMLALREAARKRDVDGSCHRVRMELDVLLAQGRSFTFRRPDVVVYRCLPDTRSGLWNKPRAEDVVIVVEVVSEHSAGVDLLEKRARYAAAGIPHYWIVRMALDDGPAVSVERLRLTTEGIYTQAAVAVRDKDLYAVDTVDPFELALSWEALDVDVT